MAGRVVVDEDLCQGHGVCESEAPEVFEVGPDRKVVVLQPVLDDDALGAASMAVRYCPTHALSLQETETTENR